MYNTTFLNYYALNIQVHMGSKIIISEKKDFKNIFLPIDSAHRAESKSEGIFFKRFIFTEMGVSI